MNFDSLLDAISFFESLAQDAVFDPEKAESELIKGKERQKRFVEKLTPEQKSDIYRTKHLRRTEKAQSGSLQGLIIQFSVKLKTIKSEGIKAVKKKMMADKDKIFNSYIQVIAVAKDKADKDPNPENKDRLKKSIVALQNEIENYIAKHPAIQALKEQLIKLYDFRNDATFFDSLTNEPPPIQQVDITASALKTKANSLLSEFSKYGQIINIITQIASKIEEITTELKTGGKTI